MFAIIPHHTKIMQNGTESMVLKTLDHKDNIPSLRWQVDGATHLLVTHGASLRTTNALEIRNYIEGNIVLAFIKIYLCVLA